MRRTHSRRGFLVEVGRGMVMATVGSALAADLELAPHVGADEGPERLQFGSLEPLVELMQETAPSQILGAVIERINAGTNLKELVAAGALANARTFGGEDYVGFHTLMAMAPAFHMSRELSASNQALPVLKVLYRNTNRIQEFGGAGKEVLHRVANSARSEGESSGEGLRDLVRRKDLTAAEQAFAGIASHSPEAALNALLFAVQDNTEVHRTVLPYRAWDLLEMLGPEHAHTLLRQSLRYCVKSERDWKHTPEVDRPRVVLPKLLDAYRLVGKPLGTRPADDATVEALARTIFEGTPDQAAEAAAAALAEGLEPSAVGEALAIAANQLVLRDAGRTEREVQPGKPLGSVHGDSIGVHACDSANAWRNMARVSNPRNTVACLILGAFQVAYDRVNRGGDFLHWLPRPHDEELRAIDASAPETLLGALEEAIRGNDQARACAITARIGRLGQPERPVFDRLLKYAVSEDGALHAEKYYRTVCEEFAATRPAFRWRQLVALARVTASEFGRPAAGIAEARERLKIQA